MNPSTLTSTLKQQYRNFTTRPQGITRTILSTLFANLQAPHILVLTGLRRTGKSTLLAQIAHHYLQDTYYFVNFEDDRLLNFQVSDFDTLHETLISLFGNKTTFLFDEIQTIPNWEHFVRRLHDQGYKCIITGSNASLLQQELGTLLTGRSITTEVFPFSFDEYLTLKNITLPQSIENPTVEEKGTLLQHLLHYLQQGGIPDALNYPELPIHQTLYDNVLYRDIAARHNIDNTQSLKELAFYLASNPTAPISFNKLKEQLKLGSLNTIKSYIDHLEDSWLFFTINKYAHSVREQQIAAKKIYPIDTGLAKTVGFSFSDDYGKLLETAVFLHLRRKHHEIYYYKTQQGHEVDFFLPRVNTFIQVTQHLNATRTREREIRSLLEAAKINPKAKLLLITEREKTTITEHGYTIEVIPLYEHLIG